MIFWLMSALEVLMESRQSAKTVLRSFYFSLNILIGLSTLLALLLDPNGSLPVEFIREVVSEVLEVPRDYSLALNDPNVYWNRLAD